MPENKKKRLFIALNLPPELREMIAQNSQKILGGAKDVKWTRPEGFHITLHFIGDTDSETENRIKIALQSLDNKFAVLRFKTFRIAAFPNLAKPRVIFIECKQLNGNSSIKLQSIMARNLAQIGIKTDYRPWRPHITIGRVRELQTPRLPDELAWPDLPEFEVTTFDLMCSELKPDGAVYTIIENYKLSKS